MNKSWAVKYGIKLTIWPLDGFETSKMDLFYCGTFFLFLLVIAYVCVDFKLDSLCKLRKTGENKILVIFYHKAGIRLRTKINYTYSDI